MKRASAVAGWTAAGPSGATSKAMRPGHARTTIAVLSDDELLLVLSHLSSDADLASLACASRKFPVLVLAERARLRAERAKAAALEKAKERAARAHFASLASDERLLRTVIKYMLVNAPKGYSIEVDAKGRKQLAAPPNGVCRLRIGICHGSGPNGGITFNEKKADWMVDVLAMQEDAVRQVEFRGEPLGAAGAAVAVRQAKVPQLNVPKEVAFYGKAFRLFIRADVSDPEYLSRLMRIDEP